MNEILNGVALHLFGRNLSQELYVEDYDEEFINLYKNAITECIYGDFTFCEENLNLFDAIFVYSYILHLDESNPDKEYLGFMKKFLIKNNINPLNFSMYFPDISTDSKDCCPFETSSELYPFEG